MTGVCKCLTLRSGLPLVFLILGSLQCSLSALAGPTVKNHVWLDVEGNPCPFQDDEEIQNFLRTAEVTSIENLPEGVTGPKKITLEKEGIRVHGVFRDVEIHRRTGPGRGGKPMLDFTDSCLYECAAYRLSRLLGIESVPPVVRRKVKGTGGTVQIYIEDGMMEKDRQEQKLEPPNRWRWMMQNQVLALFDNLIHNDDRNVGNLVIDRHWNLWMIDHTRGFRKFEKLPQKEAVKYCETSIWSKLKTLDDMTIREELDEYLSDTQIDALLERRNKLVEHIGSLIKKDGEKKVLFTFY